VTWTE